MLRTSIFLAALLLAPALPAVSQEKIAGPYRIKIGAEKDAVAEVVLPVDGRRRVGFQMSNMYLRVLAEGKPLQAGNLWVSLKTDETVQHGGPWRLEAQNIALPKTAAGKPRDGYYSVYSAGRIRITQSVEVVPGLKPGAKERLTDTVIVRYTLENKDSVPHRVGLRQCMNCFLNDSDSPVFAAPTLPGKLLDGVVLKGRTMPDYLQILQHNNLKEPGYVAHMSFALGSSVERPDKVVLTGRGAGTQDNWTMDAVAAANRVLFLYWDPREIKPGGKRELAFAYGGGIAESLDNEGKVKLELSGSLEPGKRFTVNAFVSAPAPGQSLTLELPPNMQLLHGQETQPVPAADRDGNCLVQWQARVVRTGDSTLRIHSSTGIAYTRNISIALVAGK